MKSIIKPALALIMLSAISVNSAEAQRTVSTINDRWDFKRADESSWHSINLPHTYNLDAYSKLDYYQGKGYYRKSFSLPDLPDDRRVFLKIDAASKAADLTLNGKPLGSHNGGYSSFTFDITPYIATDNILEITVDNNRSDITPLWADFTFWGGIYRDAWLITTPLQHFNMLNHGSPGVFVSTPEVNENQGTVNMKCEVTNDATRKASIEVVSNLYDPEGRIVDTMRRRVNIDAGTTDEITLATSVDNPVLWSPEEPRLYKLTTQLRDTKTGQELDSYTTKVGFRWFTFDGPEGFTLNGKPYKLRGVNRHQDQWPVGVAIDNEVNRRDIALMKELGCNFIRIAHYPQDDALLDACDELGLLAWEEIPVIDMVPDNAAYDDNCEVNLREMIRQHYNHPSIIIWGYMNEILLIAPGPDKPEWPACRERTVNLARRLEKTLKAEDPYRTSAMAYNMTDLYNQIGLDLVDVSGWNLYHGWYVGELQGFNDWMNDQHNRYPNRPVIISEWGAGSDRRLHSDASKAFDFSIEYQQKYIEHYLPFIEETKFISGSSYWNFIDFNVAARQESMPRVNNKGLFYNDRTPKDVAYYFKAMWRNDTPVLHIASRDRSSRIGNDGDKHPVKIYTNLDEVELTVNGVSVGKGRPDNCNVTFYVELPQGTSTLVAKGTRDGKSIHDAMTISRKAMPDLAKGEELAINVGSNCDFTSDVSNLTWLADRPYTAGGWGYTGKGEERSTTSEILNTVDGPIYQTWRDGIESYRIDAPEGDYEIELLMADVSRQPRPQANLLGKGDTTQSMPGTRFDITINGNTVESDFSAADGERYRNAFRRRYIIRNNGDSIIINFKPVKGNPYLSGIKIRKM